jgi:polysaccharide chain length determinant protein (PEP-CTERM system associated)
MALAVVKTLLDTFVRDVIRGGQGASEIAGSFLREQIAEYERMLAEREEALAQFKRENVGLLPGAEGDYFLRIQTAMEVLADTEADLRTALNRRDALRAQLVSGTPMLPITAGTAPDGTPSATPPGPLGELQTRIDALEESLSDYLLRFTDAHPDVVATKQQLERLYQQQKEELAALAAATGSEFEGSALSTNPVYQSTQIALNEMKVEIAALESEVAEQRQRVANLRGRMDVLPAVEAQLAGLTRDYDQVKSIHDELVSRLEKERLGTAAVADDVNFSVIEQPGAPLRPVAPNRLLLLGAAFLLSVGVGGATAVVLGKLHPVFSSARALKEFAELPVLGSISVMRDRAERLVLRWSVAGYIALGVLLGIVFVATVGLRNELAALAQALMV